MSSLDDFEILVNPSNDYFEKLSKDIVRDEGWPLCPTDYQTRLTTHTKFWFIVAREKSTDTPVSCIAIALDEHSCIEDPLFIMGMYYCNPKYRAIGVGSKVFDTAMAIPPKGSNVTGHGVMKMYKKYSSKYGFSQLGLILMFTTFQCKDIQKVTLPPGFTTKAISEVDWSELEAYEKKISPRPHPKFLKKWITAEKTNTRVAYNSEGELVGLCCIREDLSGNLTCAPFYAEHKDVGIVLLSDILTSLDLTKFGKVQMLNPKNNQDVEKLVSEMSGGKYSTEEFCRSQFNHKIIAIPEHKVYSFTESDSSIM